MEQTLSPIPKLQNIVFSSMQATRAGEGCFKIKLSRLIDCRRKIRIHELVGTCGNLTHPSSPSQHARHLRLICTENTTAKAYINCQVGTLYFSLNQLATKIWELLPPVEHTNTSSTYTRHWEHTSRPSISPFLLEETLEADTTDICLSSETVQSTRYRSACRLYGQSSASLYELEPGFESNSDRRSVNSMNSFTKSTYESAMESDNASSPKEQRKTTSAGYIGSPLLIDGHISPLLVSMAIEPPVILDAKAQTMLSIPSDPYPWTNPNWKLSVWKFSGDNLKVKDSLPLQFIYLLK
ncbi:hypothetical protein NQZ79_g6247 [Umbelopsis isabellina]|nr:hypothetical protein NQZ79_g6247 [Umbelopsis isabellina]